MKKSIDILRFAFNNFIGGNIMKAKTTKIMGILLTLVMLVTMLGAFTLSASAAEVASGTTGDVSWSFDDTTGTLTFSGEGAIGNDQLWIEHMDLITSIVIEDGITSIANYAFYECASFESVTLPASLTTIGNYAFTNCSELKSVTIPASVTKIGNSAFYRCISLTTVNYLGKSELTVGDYVFAGCSLTTVNVPIDYEGDTFAGLNVSKILVPASHCDHDGTFDTATGNCTACGEFAAVASLAVPNDLLYFATLENAITTAHSHPGSTVMLLDEVKPSAALQISNTLIIDLNGHTVTGASIYNSGNLTIVGSGSYNGNIENRGTMVINANVDGEVAAYDGKLTVIGGTIQSMTVYDNYIVSLKGGTFNNLRFIKVYEGLNNSVDLSSNLYKLLANGKLYSHSDIDTQRYSNDPYNGMLIDSNGNIGHAWFTSPVSVLEDDPVKPTISNQPVDGSHSWSDPAEALGVTATNNDDGGTLSYQWYSDIDGDATDGTAITGATEATYTPPTDVVGTVYYYCVVTNSKTGFEPKSSTTSAVKVTVTKVTPTASDFTLTPPTDLTYNGEGKTATVTAKDGIAGMGEITVKYYKDGNQVASPIDAGTYTVKVDVAEGTNYSAVTELEIGSFTIDDGVVDFSGEIARLEQAINDLKNEYGADVTELEKELASLKSQISDSNAETGLLKTAISVLKEDVEELEKSCATKAELGTAVSELTDLINKKADASALTEAIKNINDILGTIPDGTDIGTELAALDAAIDELNADVATNASGISANETAISNLTGTVNTLKTSLEAKDAELAEGLGTLEENLGKLEDRVAANEADIDKLQSELDKIVKDLAEAEKELADAIASGDAALSGRINFVNASLSSARTALEKADADNKAELIARIETVEATLNAAIKSVQKNLDDAKSALEKALADGDKANADALAQAISELNGAIDAAEAAATAADGTLRSELTAKIDSADAALKAAIDALAGELDSVKNELEARDNELQTFTIIVCVISSVALCGSGAFVVWFFIDRKKRI